MGSPAAPHVLVIDDDLPSLRLAERTLAYHGYRTTCRAWPDLRPDEVAASAASVVVLDIRFGGEHLGLEFLAALKADAATADLPVLVCSADAFAVLAAEGRLAAVGCGVLLKPYRPADLARAVARFCGDGLAAPSARPHAA